LKIPGFKGRVDFSELLEKFSLRQLILLAVAASVLITGIVYFVLLNMSHEDNAQEKTVMVRVVVAKEDIPQRTIISESMLKMVSFPSGIMPPGAVTDMGSIVGKPARVPIMQDDVLTDRKVLTDVRMAGFTGAIPPDCRAVSIGITDITGVSGFARAGDYVDVMLISDKKDKQGISGEIILQNVLLLALNKTADSVDKPVSEQINDKDKKGNKDNNGPQPAKEPMSSATLAVRPEEALRLAVAQKEGQLYLVLRPFKPTDMFVLETGYFALQAADAPAPQPAASMPADTGRQWQPSVPQAVLPTAPESSSNKKSGDDFGIVIIRGGRNS
jgi:pilus assembly protein CpaB